MRWRFDVSRPKFFKIAEAVANYAKDIDGEEKE